MSDSITQIFDCLRRQYNTFKESTLVIKFNRPHITISIIVEGDRETKEGDLYSIGNVYEKTLNSSEEAYMSRYPQRNPDTGAIEHAPKPKNRYK